MPNDTNNHRTFPTQAKQNHPKRFPDAKAKPTSAEFLIDTNILPLVLIGKGVKSFGWRVVIAFMLGGGSVFGYAVVRPLPYPAKVVTVITPAPSPAPPTKMVRLHGQVRDSNQRPVTESFSVGVLAGQLGPVQNPEGSFVLEVPESSHYDFAVWTDEESKAKFYNGQLAEQDDRGLKLQNPLTFRLPDRAAGPTASQHSNTKSRNDIARTFVEQ